MVPHITSLGKDQNPKVKVQFLLKEYLLDSMLAYYDTFLEAKLHVNHFPVVSQNASINLCSHLQCTKLPISTHMTTQHQTIHLSRPTYLKEKKKNFLKMCISLIIDEAEVFFIYLLVISSGNYFWISILYLLLENTSKWKEAFFKTQNGNWVI